VSKRRDNPDLLLQARVAVLFQLWDDIRWVFRMLPKPEQVAPSNIRWVTHPPTRNVVPRLITHAAMQPITPKQRRMIMHGLSAWSAAYTQMVAIAALPQEDRPPEMYSDATAALHECADQLANAVVSLRRSLERKHRRHGIHPVE
jgi:hypothetical protein